MEHHVHVVVARRMIVPICFFLLGLATLAHGQFDPFNPLNGEPIVGQVSTTFTLDEPPNADVNDNIIATPTGIYDGSDDTQIHLYTSYESRWKPPIPKRIKSIGKKINSKSILILLDDGSVWVYMPPETTAKQIGKIGSVGSETWEKVLGDALYVFSSSFLYVSRDTGATWQKDTAGLNGAYTYGVALDTAQNVLLASSRGLMVQDAAGGAWSVNAALPTTTGINTVFVDRKDRMLVGTNFETVYMSSDKGASWSMDTAGLMGQTAKFFSDDVYGNLYVATFSNQIFKSSGGAPGWTEIDGGILALCGVAPTMNGLSGDSVLHASTSAGAFRSSDRGASWTSDNQGITAETFAAVAKATNNKYVVSTALAIFAQGANDTTWNKVYPKTGYANNLQLYSDNTGNLFTLDRSVNTNYAAPPIFKSTDNGATWNIDSAGESAIDGSVFFIDENGVQHFGNSLYGSSFYCHMWQRAPGGAWMIDTVGFPVANESSILCIGSDKAGYLYTSGYLPGKKVVRRPIAGGTWMVDTVGLPAGVNNFSKLYAGANGDLYGFASQAICRRHANSWAQVPLPAFAENNYYTVSAMTVDHNGILFVAFEDVFSAARGVWFTSDNGGTWNFAGVDSVPVTILNSIGDTTYALTNGYGIHEVTAHAVSAVRDLAAQPNALALESFPNPFSDATTIRFSTPAGYHATVKLFDMLGSEVASLQDASSTASAEHAINWNAHGVVRGVYACRVIATPSQAGAPVLSQTTQLVVMH